MNTPPPSSDALYDDPVAGPPDVVIRDQGSGILAATYLEIGLDDASRAYFERDGGGQVDLPLGFLAPLNRYSRIENMSKVQWGCYYGTQKSSSGIDPGDVRAGIAVDDTLHFLTFYRRGLAQGMSRQMPSSQVSLRSQSLFD